MSISGVSPRGTAVIGRISDGSHAVSGAIVTISNRGFVQSTTTDETGRFLFEAVPSGRYAFRTSAQGYAVYECPMVIRDGDRRVNRVSITALVSADRQTVSVAELRRRQWFSAAPKQTENVQDSLR
ncbi:MAG: carboxypeptidase-like regulatory domain-containing protein [Acidobacteriota bacterium]|nr:carboxypeptidase-like regulatory domain-containing protein [Acidobacteriota bacterium]